METQFPNLYSLASYGSSYWGTIHKWQQNFVTFFEPLLLVTVPISYHATYQYCCLIWFTAISAITPFSADVIYGWSLKQKASSSSIVDDLIRQLAFVPLISLSPGTVLVGLRGGYPRAAAWGHLVVVHDLPLALSHEDMLLVVDLNDALHRQEGKSAQQCPPQLALN